MPSRSLAELESMVGERVRSVAGLAVERSAVAPFARATFDARPMFADADAAREAGHPAIPAPPTFTRVSYFPHNRPAGVDANAFDVGFEKGRTLHGEQAYEYERPVYVGDVLGGTTELTDVFRREGSGGRTLTFAVLETVYRDDDGDGERVVTERRTRIEVGDDGTGGENEETGEGGESRADEGGHGATARTTDAELRVGPLTRVDFARYAGASGDFNPLHLSDPAARAAGHRSVFAHGMLTAGIAARYARERLGLASLRAFRTRFESQVWPGETLVVTGETTAGANATALALHVETADGRTVLTGDASAGAATTRR